MHDEPMKVEVLIDWTKVGWDEDKMKEIFLDFEADRILQIPLSESSSLDNLVWHYPTDGDYSSRTGATTSLDGAQRIRDKGLPPQVTHGGRSCGHSYYLLRYLESMFACLANM